MISHYNNLTHLNNRVPKICVPDNPLLRVEFQTLRGEICYSLIENVKREVEYFITWMDRLSTSIKSHVRNQNLRETVHKAYSKFFFPFST